MDLIQKVLWEAIGESGDKSGDSGGVAVCFEGIFGEEGRVVAGVEKI